MKRLTLTVVAAALGSFLVLSPAFAQDTDSPVGEITEGSWEGSQFDNAATATDSIAPLTGEFIYTPDNGADDREITSIWLRTTFGVADDTCEAPVVRLANGNPVKEPGEYFKATIGEQARARRFAVTVESECNRTVTAEAWARAWSPNVLLETRDSKPPIETTMTIAAPSQYPATDVAAEVEDTDDREVDVSWAFPETAEPDTTYVVQRLGPDAGEDTEWVDVSDELTIDDEPSWTDDVSAAVEDGPVTGAYKYRVIAVRPHADAATIEDEVAEVYVGVPPTTTTTTPTSSTVTQPRSATTITIPRLGSSHTPNRNSTHTTVTPQGPPTTIDTGFEETLDYGDRPEDSEPGELAAEGQSIISTDDESVVGPGAVAASLMVLFGWAGHVVYFRRLAAQF